MKMIIGILTLLLSLILLCSGSAGEAAQGEKVMDWLPLGTGIDGAVTALAVYNGQLIAAGWFTTAGGVEVHNVTAWDGVAWQPLGSGVDQGVNALAVWDNKLFIGGYLTSAGGEAATRIAVWNGANWGPVGNAYGANEIVTCLAVYRNQLIAGGYFTRMDWPGPHNRIASWNGSTWSNLGSGLNDAVWSLLVVDTNLIVGGRFTQAGELAASRAALWSGSGWSSFGQGLNDWVRALGYFDANYFAGGQFAFSGGASADHIGWRQGDYWLPPLGTTLDGTVFAMCGESAVVGGAFVHSGEVTLNHIAHWDGSGWQPLGLGTNGTVYALTVFEGKLVAAGEFSKAGLKNCANIAIWTEVTYECGDHDGDGVAKITDVVFLINYIFSGGPAPMDISGGDVNCDGRTSITDAVYYVNFIFDGGPAPCAACP